MIKSSKSSLKFTNSGKLQELHNFIDEYKRVMGIFIDQLWDMERVPTLLPKELTENIDTWLSARMIQCCGKQASGIVRGTRKKQEKRKWQIEKLALDGKTKEAEKLQAIYNEVNMSKPVIDDVNPELDSRFVKIDLEHTTSFDGWITLGSIGNKMKLIIPFKRHKHFNKMMLNGKLKDGIRISKEEITFMFELPEVVKKTDGEVLGIDVGIKNVLSCSNGYTSGADIHGHTAETIMKKIARRKKGSVGFRKACTHRTNYINHVISQLNVDSYKQVNIEDIKDLRKGKRNNRFMSSWTYTEVFDKLESYCESHGVLVNKVDPVYTSQRCSVCGWTQKSNRNGKKFKCQACGQTQDADLNKIMINLYVF